MPPAARLSRGEATRQRVLSKAIEHVRNSGVSGLSVEQVSKEVGVTRQTTYKHFSTKQDLLFVIAVHESQRQVDELSTRLQDSIPAQDGGALESGAAKLIADGLLMLVELAHRDPAAGLLLTTDTPLEARDAGELEAAVVTVLRSFWEPVLRPLAAADLLTSSVERTITWLTFIHFVMVTSSRAQHGTAEGLRAEVERHVTPAVLRV